MREEFLKFGFEEFGAKTFVNDAGMFAIWARRWNFGVETTGVAYELVGIRVESKR